MRKLKLSIEELSVESFVAQEPRGSGTILAHETEIEFCGGVDTEGPVFTCLQWGTCQGIGSCNGGKTCDIHATRCCGPTIDFC